MNEIFRDDRDGFELIGLRNSHVELRVAPALGGKMVRLTDIAAHRQWMWHPGSELKLFANTLGDAFERSTMIGADECLPSVASCTADERSIPDHGEVWSLPWQVECAAGNQIRLQISLPISPLDFLRTIQLDGNVIEFRYSLRNRSDVPQYYLWAFHPLLRIEEGDRIELPAGTRELLVETTSWPDTARGQKWSWPRPRPGIDLSKLDLNSLSAYAKYFFSPLPTGQISVVNPERGQRLSFECNSSHITAIGLWLSRGGWNGYHHLAIEPTSAPADSLDQAIRENLCESIAPGKSIEWSFRILIGP